MWAHDVVCLMSTSPPLLLPHIHPCRAAAASHVHPHHILSMMHVTATVAQAATVVHGRGDAVSLTAYARDCTTVSGFSTLAVSSTVKAQRGTTPTAFALVGSLPSGLSLNTATGAITGTMTTATFVSVSIRPTDGAGRTGAITATVSMCPCVCLGWG